MQFKTPSFWYPQPAQNGGALSALLTPFSWLYGLGHTLHQKRGSPKQAGIPVICVGNITAGGSGKTPTAIALSYLIRQQSKEAHPCFLTRGYGDDEQKILEQHCPVIVNADRFAGAQQAKAQDYTVVIMDDGMQNTSLHKDLTFVVIDGGMGFGNQKMIPAGPLRTPLSTGLDKADAFVLIGEDKHDIVAKLPLNKPLFRAHIKPSRLPEKEASYLAFAGLGYPQKFFSFLEELGLDLFETVSFPDHYAYSEDDINALIKKAEKENIRLITTEKDIVKVPEFLRPQIDVLPITLQWDNQKALVEFLKDYI